MSSDPLDPSAPAPSLASSVTSCPEQQQLSRTTAAFSVAPRRQQEQQQQQHILSPEVLHNHLNNLCTMAGSPPPPSAAGSDEADFGLFLGSGGLSFENPNYQFDKEAAIASCMDPARLEDQLNSNIEPSTAFEDLKKDLSQSGNTNNATKRRGNYAVLDATAMGVDVVGGPRTELDDNKRAEEEERERRRKEKQFGGRMAEAEEEEKESEKLEETGKEKAEKSDGEEDTARDDDDDGGRQPVVRRRGKKGREQQRRAEAATRQEEEEEDLPLPSGWERHHDELGAYFWHVKSGTIQRTPPQQDRQSNAAAAAVVRDVRSSKIFDEDFDPLSAHVVAAAAGARAASPPSPRAMTKSCTTASIAELAREKKAASAEESGQKGEWKRRSMPPKTDSIGEEQFNKTMQIQVQSLGCLELREDELTPENSSKAVNRCIVELSTPVGVGEDGDSSSASSAAKPALWGGGRTLTLELGEGSLRLIDGGGQVLNSQPIHTIRVWGVGRDNGRDFAYVARDKLTRRHLCHVFRCDIPARAIANALRDICKKILIERSLAQSSSKIMSSVGRDEAKAAVDKPTGANKTSTPAAASTAASSSASRSGGGGGGGRLRPTSLGAVGSAKLQTRTVPAPESFPTPMEEPRKVLKAFFLGTLQVDKPCGIETIHGAIEHLMNSVPRAEWKNATVAVAPSTVTITYSEERSGGGSKRSQRQQLDCRVRFLSFLGIGEDSRQAAFIMHTAQDTFVAHVFHVEPNAGPLCKTIEAACKLRYQKCLDARPQQQQQQQQQRGGDDQGSTSSSLGKSLKSMLLRGRNRILSPPSASSTSPPPS